MKPFHSLNLDNILKKARREETLSRQEMLFLLGLKKWEDQEKVFEVARELRNRYFHDKIFFYGFIYFSTWCRNDCVFCHYRSSNTFCDRYRKTNDQILEAACNLAVSGVHLLDLTMGEDPRYYNERHGFESLLALLKTIQYKTHLPLMVSWGAIPDEVLHKLPEVGADWLACYQETHNPELFRRLRLRQDYDRRLRIKYRAMEAGLFIEEGILSGVGETLEDIVDSMEAMKKMNAHQIRVMNFVPQKGTPMEHFPPPHRNRENMIIAILRLLLPHRHIPASLDVYGIDGLKDKLNAGANIITSLIPPDSELRGVAQGTLGVSEGHRTVRAVTPILDGLGLERASLEDYISWMDQEKRSFSKRFSLVRCIVFEGNRHWGKITRG